MSDTVLIALITFASGFVGALSGYVTAKMSAKEQRKREVDAMLFQTRLKTYSEFLEALEKWAVTPGNVIAKAHIFRKISEASLVSSAESAKYFDEVQLYIDQYEGKRNPEQSESFLASKAYLLSSLRKDLHIHVPEEKRQ